MDGATYNFKALKMKASFNAIVVVYEEGAKSFKKWRNITNKKNFELFLNKNFNWHYINYYNSKSKNFIKGVKKFIHFLLPRFFY